MNRQLSLELLDWKLTGQYQRAPTNQPWDLKLSEFPYGLIVVTSSVSQHSSLGHLYGDRAAFDLAGIQNLFTLKQPNHVRGQSASRCCIRMVAGSSGERGGSGEPFSQECSLMEGFMASGLKEKENHNLERVIRAEASSL